MQLVFIRHGEPNYEIDSLTQEGFLEADLLAKRIVAQKWPVTDIFCSPLGRAQDTARPTLQALGRKAETCSWLREFGCGDFTPPDGSREIKSTPWDFYPDYWTADPLLCNRDQWTQADVMQRMPQNVAQRFAEVSDGLDSILARYGYHRENAYYRVDADAQKDAMLVFFCHLGLTGAACGHLLHIAPPVLWHSFFLPASSVTVLNTEQRQPDIAGFRCQVMGDTQHLLANGREVSPMGAFGPLFNG